MAPELPESLREVAERAASVLAPETDLFEDMDSAGLGDALTKAFRAALSRPVTPAKAVVHLASSYVKIPIVAGARWLGRDAAAAGRGRPQGPPVRRACLGGQSRVLLHPAGLPGDRQGRPGRDRVRPDGSRPEGEGPDGPRPAGRRAGPDQLPADQPGGPAAGVRHRGRQPDQGRSGLRRRCDQQRRQAPAGGYQRLRGWRQRGLHAVKGGVPQRLDGAAAVRTADRAGTRHAAAVQPAVDQQVLRDGPGAEPELHRMGRQTRPHGLRHQLPESVRGDVRYHDGRLPGEGTADRARRDRADHRSRDHRHRRAVPGRGDDGDHRGLPDPGGGQPDRHPDPVEHDAGLRRSPVRWVRSPTSRRSSGSRRRCSRPARSRARRWPARSTCSAPTT